MSPKSASIKPMFANDRLLFPCVAELAVAAATVSLQVEHTDVCILWLKLSGGEGREVRGNEKEQISSLLSGSLTTSSSL